MGDQADPSSSPSRSPLFQRMQSGISSAMSQSDADARTKENNYGRFNSPLRAKPSLSPKRPFGVVMSANNLSNRASSSTSANVAELLNAKQSIPHPTHSVSSSTARVGGVMDGKTAIKAFLSPKPSSIPTSPQELSVAESSCTVVFPPGPCGLELEPSIVVGNRQVGCRIKAYHIVPGHSGIDPRVLRRAVSIGDIITHIDAEDVLTTKFFGILEMLRDSKDRQRALTFKRNNSMANNSLVSMVQESRLATPTMAPPLSTTRSAIIEQMLKQNSTSKTREKADVNMFFTEDNGEESDEIEQGDLEEEEVVETPHLASTTTKVTVDATRGKNTESAHWREYSSPTFSPSKIREMASQSRSTATSTAMTRASPSSAKKSLSYTPLDDESSKEGRSISYMNGDSDDENDDSSYMGSPIEPCKLPVITKDLGQMLGSIGSGIIKASTAIGAAVGGKAYGNLLPKYSHEDMEKVMSLKHSLLSELSTSCIQLGKLEEELEAARNNEAKLQAICNSEQERIFELEAEVGRLRNEKVVLDSKLRVTTGEKESSSENNVNYLNEIDEWKKMVSELQGRLNCNAGEVQRLEQALHSQSAQLLEESALRRKERESMSAQLNSLTQASHMHAKQRKDVDAQLLSALNKLAASEKELAVTEARLELLQESFDSEAQQREKNILLIKENLSAQCNITKESCDAKDNEIAVLREEIHELSTRVCEAEKWALSQAAACTELSSEVSASSMLAASYQSEIRDIQSKLEDALSSAASLRLSRDEASDSIVKMADELKAMEVVKCSMRDEILALNEHIERSANEHSYKKGERIELLRQIEFEKTQNESYSHDLSFAQEAMSSLEEELVASRAICHELECEIDNFEHIISIKDEDICRKHNQIDSLITKNEEGANKINELASKEELLVAERELFAIAAEEQKQLIATLQSDACELEREYEQACGNLAESTKMELTLRSKIDELSCVVSGLELQISSYSDKVSVTEDLQIKATLEWQQKLNTLLVKHAERESTFSKTLAAADEAHKSEVAELESQLGNSHEVIAAIQKEFNIFRHGYEDKVQENASLYEVKESFSQRLDCLASDFALLQTELEESKSLINGLRAEIMTRDGEVNRLQTENDSNASLRCEYESSCKKVDELLDENKTLSASLDDITSKSLAYTKELASEKAEVESKLRSLAEEMAIRDASLLGDGSVHADKVIQLKKELEYLRTDVLVAVNMQNAMHREYCKNESNFKVQIETAETISATLEAKLADMTKRQQAALRRAELAERNIVDTEQRCISSLGRTVALEQALNDSKDELVVLQMQLNESNRTMNQSQSILISKLRTLEAENSEKEEITRELESRLEKISTDRQIDIAALQKEYDDTLEACRKDRARVISSYETRLLEKSRESDFALHSQKLEFEEKIDTLTFLHKQEIQSAMHLEDESKRILQDEFVSSRLSDELQREQRTVERLTMEKDMMACKQATIENKAANAIKAYEEQASAAGKLETALKEKEREFSLLAELKDIAEQNKAHLDHELASLKRELAARDSVAEGDSSRCKVLEAEMLVLQQALLDSDGRIQQLHEANSRQLADITKVSSPHSCIDASTSMYDDISVKFDAQSQTQGEVHDDVLSRLRGDLLSLQLRSDEMLAAMLAQTSVLMDAEQREAEYKANRFSLEQYVLNLERRLQSSIESSSASEQSALARHLEVISQMQSRITEVTDQLAVSEGTARSVALQLAAKSKDFDLLSAQVQDLLVSSYTPMKHKQQVTARPPSPLAKLGHGKYSSRDIEKSGESPSRAQRRPLSEMAMNRSDYSPDVPYDESDATDVSPLIEEWHDRLIFLSLELHQSLRRPAEASDGGAASIGHQLYSAIVAAPWISDLCERSTLAPLIATKGSSGRVNSTDSLIENSAADKENDETTSTLRLLVSDADSNTSVLASRPVAQQFYDDHTISISSNNNSIGGSNNSSSMALAVEDSDSVRMSINQFFDSHSHANGEEGPFENESFWNLSSDSSVLMLDRSADDIE